MIRTRRGILAIAIGAIAAACSDGGVVKLTQGDGDASSGVEGGADASADTSTSDAATSRTFVGTVTGTDANVGFVVESGVALLFFCGGAQTYTTHTKWFRGQIALGAPFMLTQPAPSTAKASGTLMGGGVTVTGTFDRGDGNALAWTATAVSPATAAVLYEASTADGTAALIVTQPTPNDTPSLQGAFKLDAGGVIQQVVPLMPLNDGFRVQINVDGGTTTLDMFRAHPHL